MGLLDSTQSAHGRQHWLRHWLQYWLQIGARLLIVAAGIFVGGVRGAEGQVAPAALAGAAVSQTAVSQRTNVTSMHAARARQFLGGRALTNQASAAQAMVTARQQHAAMLGAASPRLSNLNAAWQPLGPSQVASIAYGKITGRIGSIAIDPADATGNTVYLGTTGGGVWKSTNAAGPAADVTFTALTDTLPVFSANARSSAVPSLSIGAVSVQSGVVLAGTGDPNDATDSFYGGGILRSADGGLTWTLIQDSMDGVAGNHSFVGLGFAGFAWSSASPSLVVAAVSQAAEGVLVNAPDTNASVMGLYYSMDAGVTWQMSTIMDGSQAVQGPSGGIRGGRAATAVVWNPVRQRFYAAIRFHGYYESADGAIWTRLIRQPGTGLTSTACPTSPTSAGSVACPIFRGALAVQSATGDTFALTVDSNNLDQGLWQDVCGSSGGGCTGGIAFGKQLSSSPLEMGNGSSAIAQGDYNLDLAAVPSGPGGPAQDTLLYAGTVDLYRCSLAAGCLLRNTTNAANGCAAPARVAPAQHAIATLATSSQPLIYVGNDGGLWRSTDGVNQQDSPCSTDDASHFDNLNGGLGSLAEVVSFAQSPSDPGVVLAGLGASGTAATGAASGANMAWPQLSVGEGGTVAIDQGNPLLWYVSTGAGVNIRQCTSGASCSAASFSGPATIGAVQTSSDASLIDVPWLLDPAFPSDVLIGTCRVWRGPAADGSLWSTANAISKLLGGPQNAACSSTNPVLRSLAASGPASSATAAQNAGSQVLYAGMAGTLDGGGTFGGHLFSTSNAGTAGKTTAWNDLTLSPVTNDPGDLGRFNPGGFDISSLAADSHDATGKTIYATVMGFAGNGTNAPHLYRSIDGGAHWTNISGNLPNAPANSVVVDPNDANTVYVALDTGVYVTTQVATCSTANCWSIYGTSLPNAPVIALSAATAMPTGDGRNGELRAATYGRGIWQIPLFTALTSIQPAISLSPTSLLYGAQAVATASNSQTITVTNTGNAPLTVRQIAVTGDFASTDTCTTAAIEVGSSCSVRVRFVPTATGSRTGVLTIFGNVAGGQATATLSGTGTPAAAIVLNPVFLSFNSTTVNATSAVQNITISNTGNISTALQSPSIVNGGGDFKITANTCGATLAPSTGCTVAIVFTPTASGSRDGTFSITDDSGTQTATLTGAGTSPATDALSPLAVSFAAQQLGTASTAQEIVLTNAGDVALTLISAQITSGDFTAVNACGNSLNAHSICSINVAFQPKSVGPLSGVLTVSDQFRSQAVQLSGTGIAPPGVSLSPFSTITFPATGVGLTALPRVVTLTNNGGVPLTIASVKVAGDFIVVPGGDTCGTSLAVATACTLQIAFTPTMGGPRSGSVTIADNSPNSPHTVQLAGAGVDFVLNANGSTTVTTSNGKNAVFPLLLSSAAIVSGTVTFACTGAPANSTCTVTPSAVPLGGATTVSVTVLTGVTIASLSPPQPAGRHIALWLAALLPAGLLALRRTRISRLTCVGLVCVLLAAAGCGSGRVIPPPGYPGGPGPVSVTPAGTYNIVVTATSAGLTRAISLTLIVQ